jgi:hypothetical protein
MILLGLILVVTGVVIPLFMILRVIPTSFLLSFLAYAASFVGMVLGTIGAAWYVQQSRR